MLPGRWRSRAVVGRPDQLSASVLIRPGQRAGRRPMAHDTTGVKSFLPIELVNGHGTFLRFDFPHGQVRRHERCFLQQLSEDFRLSLKSPPKVLPYPFLRGLSSVRSRNIATPPWWLRALAGAAFQRADARGLSSLCPSTQGRGVHPPTGGSGVR